MRRATRWMIAICLGVALAGTTGAVAWTRAYDQHRVVGTWQAP